jgi:NADH-quinone oxidoreductase subunit J
MPEALQILYVLLAVGAAGVALIMPSTHADAARWRLGGTVLATAALAGLIVYGVRFIGAGVEGRTFFILFAAVAVTAGVRVITHPRPVYSALYFVLVVLGVTGLCVLVSADFLGIALVIVYAGAILVTYVFVIMLAQQAGHTPYDRSAREPWAALVLAFVLAAGTAQAISACTPLVAHVAAGTPSYRLATVQPPTTPGPSGADAELHESISKAPPVPVGNVRAIGESLLTTYVVAVEVAGVLLLVAVVGAIAIAQKRMEPEFLTPHELAERTEDEDVHRAGRTARPF